MARETEIQISDFLLKLGVNPSLKGYRYLRTAIEMILHDEECLSAVTKEIYPELAKKYGTTPVRAERAIRHAVECTMASGDKELIDKMFSSFLVNGKKKPTNSEFMASVAERIRLNLYSERL